MNSGEAALLQLKKSIEVRCWPQVIRRCTLLLVVSPWNEGFSQSAPAYLTTEKKSKSPFDQMIPQQDKCDKPFCYTSQNQICFPVGEKRLTCRGSKLTNPLGKQRLKLSTRTWSVRVFWNRGKFMSQPAYGKRFLRSFFSSFEFAGITKHLM